MQSCRRSAASRRWSPPLPGKRHWARAVAPPTRAWRPSAPGWAVAVARFCGVGRRARTRALRPAHTELGAACASREGERVGPFVTSRSGRSARVAESRSGRSSGPPSSGALGQPAGCPTQALAPVGRWRAVASLPSWQVHAPCRSRASRPAAAGSALSACVTPATEMNESAGLAMCWPIAGSLALSGRALTPPRAPAHEVHCRPLRAAASTVR